MRHIIIAVLIPFVVAIFFPVFAQQFTEVGQQLGVADSTWQLGYGAQWVNISSQERPDLYVSNASHFISPYRPVRNRLYINQTATGGGFEDEAPQWGVEVLHGISLAPGWADFDLDGDLDLYVTNGYGLFGSPDVPNQFYRNDGTEFTEVGAALGVDSIDWNMNSIAWGDYNGDGRPDVYLTNSQSQNWLFRNMGAHFSEEARTLGMQAGAEPSQFCARWMDYDQDGDLDLFLLVANYASHLFRNDLADQAGFTDVATQVGLTIESDAVNAVWGDYDSDGDWDVYVSINSYDANLLYRNDLAETGTFVEIARQVGIADSALTRHSSWADYDHDGDLDLLVINYNAPDRLYRNDLQTTGRFTEVTQAVGLTHTNNSNTNAVWGDYDADGDLDLYVVNTDTANWLYRNNQDDSNYLKVRFLTANRSFSRQGSTVEVYQAGTDSLIGMGQIDGGGGVWGGQDMYDVHFGLDGTQAYDLVVRSTLRVQGEPVVLDKTTRPALGNVVPIEINGFLEVQDTLDTFVGTISDPPAVPAQVTLDPAYPNPFNSATTLTYTLPTTAQVTLQVVNLRGQVVNTLLNTRQSPGTHSLRWDGMDTSGRPVASGVYFVHFHVKTSAGQVAHHTRKLLLLK